MLLSMFIILVSISAFSMFLAMNPLSMGLIILLMALTLSMTFAYSMSSWVAFLIFLIYIGGMLVMFSYFVSIIPNQTLPFLYISIMMTLSLSILMIISYIMSMSPPSMSMSISQLNIMYTNLNMPTLLILALILLFTMIVVVKLTIISKGPLRPFYYV